MGEKFPQMLDHTVSEMRCLPAVRDTAFPESLCKLARAHTYS